KIKQSGSRENRYVNDVHPQITKALVEACPWGNMFVIENVTGVRSATENVRVKNRYVSVSCAFYQFRPMLEYIAELNGHKVIGVEPKYT
ncbi:IS200/IS605 family accessory protein TnpB-related protein, partial [Bacillus thuringiensis]|uniref:IS200/IS605 family accessory protein TnpB-related protein n=1 Tax=Bacillus thuringiensis TaxID=1428 RepID=UPI0028504590